MAMNNTIIELKLNRNWIVIIHRVKERREESKRNNGGVHDTKQNDDTFQCVCVKSNDTQHEQWQKNEDEAGEDAARHKSKQNKLEFMHVLSHGVGFFL